jgi:glycosyltransferase involved in cell wall biosynthesis
MTQPSSDPLPLVSVVIPCFNTAAYVREAVDSALAQTHPRVEVLVLDDGSTDASWEAIRSFGERIVAVRQENRGLAATRNRGVSLARGDFLLFLDSDDRIDPGTVAALAAAATRAENALAACPWSYLFLEGGEWVRRAPDVPFPLTRPDPLAAWLEGEWIPGCSLLWPRALFERLGGYDEGLTADEDGDLMFRAFTSGARLVYAEGGESLYRRHGSSAVSISHDVFSEHRFRSRVRVLEKLEEELRRRGEWERYRESLGIAYQSVAQRFFGARPDLAAEALRRGEEYAGRRAVAPTRIGRVLVRLLGMERKERVVNVLARAGLMTPGRRALYQRRRLMEAESTPEPPAAP